MKKDKEGANLANNRRSLKVVTLFVALIVVIIIFLTVENLLFALLLSCYVFIFAKMLCNYKDNALMLAFLICFFVFLMGRPFANEVLGYYRDYGLKIDDEAKMCVYLCLLASLIALTCGYFLCRKIKFGRRGRSCETAPCATNEMFRRNLRKITFYVSIVAYVLAIIENVLRLVHIEQVGYEASYYLEHDFAYGMPFVFYAIAMCAPIALAIFLATLPTKKEARLPIILFLVSNLLFSIAGNRFEIIASIFAIIIYCLWRSALDGKKWISRRAVIFVVILSPIVIMLMQNMAYWRNGLDVSTDSDPMISFLYENGGSSSEIGAVHQYKGIATDGDVHYSFGGIWRVAKESSIANFLGVGESYEAQTIEYAENAHSLSAALTYYFFPTQYLEGYGLGGCYIAELYHDFSYLGVIVGNILIGFFIGSLRGLRRDGIVYNFLCFSVIMLLLRLPRDSFSYPVVTLLNLRNIIFVLCVYLITKYLTDRQINMTSSGMAYDAAVDKAIG